MLSSVDSALGSRWGWHGVPLARKLTVLLSVWFSVYEVSPTPPITVTHKPEEDTFGVSYFWAGRGPFSHFIRAAHAPVPSRSEPQTSGRKSPDE